MIEDKTKTEFCYLCHIFTRHNVLKEYKKSHYLAEDDIERRELYSLLNHTFLECCGCGSIRLKKETWIFGDDLTIAGEPLPQTEIYPPSTFRVYPQWATNLDKEWHITKLYKEIYQALKNNALTLASMGIRAIIETIMLDKIEDQGSFKKNLSKFQASGYISKVDEKIIATTLEIGHASIHRGFTPDQRHLEVSIDIAEKLLHTLYILEKDAETLKKTIPKRKTPAKD